MTVRWKPLLVLSGLFLVTAVLGLLAIVYAMVPRGSADLLGQARAERLTKGYDRAVVRYRQALQKEGKDPAIHLEMAEMYAEWAAGEVSAEKRAELHALQLRSLAEAARYGKTLAEPRRRLMLDALRQDEGAEAQHWAEELLAIAPKDLDALYVMADKALSDGAPDLAGARKSLEALEVEQPPRVRTDWVRARLAKLAREDGQLAEVLARARQTALPPTADPVDRLALLRLRVMDTEATDSAADLTERVGTIREEARALIDAADAPPARATVVGELLDRVGTILTQASDQADEADKRLLAPATEAVEQAVEAAFRKATESSKGADLRVARSYASHLLVRGKGAECRAVVQKALAAPVAASPAFLSETMELREVSIKAALADTADPQRFEKAEPSIKELLSSPSPRYQGLGHLFQGAIDLERSGLVGGPNTAEAVVDPKLRTSALSHLKDAAAQWPNSSTAQALYGIALILSQEPGLGRQYLQAARKLGGTLEPRYQIWAAWSMSEAGYPEDAAPIVKALLAQVDKGTLPHDLDGTLHLLAGEIAQARGGPEELRKAQAEYLKAIKTKQALPTAVHLRVAQLEVLQGHPDQALKRIADLRAEGIAGPAGERLAVLTLLDRKQPQEARKVLDAARKQFPENGELAGLDAAILVKSEEPGQNVRAQQADRLLADFLARHPDHVAALQLRAQILAEKLHKRDEARRLLSNASEHADTTAPLVQLTMIELADKDFDAAARAIAKIRARWKEAAAADLLDAQLAVARGNPRGAATALDSALKKDPNNKVALFWKAQLDEQSGAGGEAAKIYAEIAREHPTKELVEGLNLTTASRWAIATQALENQEFDAAIAGYKGILQGGEMGPLARPARWKLVAAYATKENWAAAKSEIQALLKDKAATDEERVQAANYFRMFKEEATAIELLDGVLSRSPGLASAVVTRSYMLANAGKPAEAAALLDKVIAADPKAPAVLSLMLAGIENSQANGQPAAPEGLKKALAALDRGLTAHPDALDLIEAKFRVLKLMAESKPQGDPGAAFAFLAARAKAEADPKGPRHRLLAEVYRREGRLAEAEAVAAEMAKADPKDPALAATLARLSVARAATAPGPEARALLEKAVQFVRRSRTAFPNDVSLAEIDCELAARRGDLPRALAITKEMDALDRSSTTAPILRARLFEAKGQPRDAAEAYAEAVERNPRRADMHLAFGQASLNIGKPDEAVNQANWVLGGAKDLPAAQLLKARGLAAIEGAPAARQARREEAAALLAKAIAAEPKFADAYHLLAEIRQAQGRRADAVAALKDGLKAAPDDYAGLSMLIQATAEPPAKGKVADPDALDNALALAREAVANAPKKADPCLAAAAGFQRAGQVEQALPWAEKACRLLDTPGLHLNYGDLLLSAAEAQADPNKARDLFEQAIAQYDLVLKAQPDAMEAINNKAWILHRHLKDDKAALALVESFLKKTDPASLPAEFFDTLGAIQEGMGRPSDAEDSYAKGLRKSPDLPALNYHMGRLVSADRARAAKAADYLQKAQEAADKLRPADREEVAQLLLKVAQ